MDAVMAHALFGPAGWRRWSTTKTGSMPTRRRS
jgi:hypothetical protein